MTTASGGVAVIATRLADTDRRALSEAWYSALHLTRGAAPAPARAARTVPASSAPARLAKRDLVEHASKPALAEPAARAQRDPGERAAPVDERRRPATETVRRIQRTVAALARSDVPAAHTLDVDGGRVRLLVHHDGRTTRVIALCSPTLREQVERALASARFALAGAGFVVGAL